MAYTTQTILSKGGIVIKDKNKMFYALGDCQLNQFTRQLQVSVVPVLNQKYPYVIQNGDANYDSGDCSGMFVEFDDTCHPKLDNLFAHHKEFLDFLTNGTTKLLQSGDGKKWIVAISGQPSVTNAEHKDKWITSFQWTEIDDASSATVLASYGLS